MISIRSHSWLTKILLFLFAFSIPLQNRLIIPEVGTATKVLGLLLIVVILFRMVYLRQSIKLGNIGIVLVIWLFLYGISYFWSISPQFTLTFLGIYLAVAFLYIMLVNIFSLKGFIQYGMLGFIMGGFALAFLQFQSYVSGNQMGGRVFIEGFNPNGVAYYMVFTSAFLVMYKNRFVRDHIFINKFIPYVGLLILLIGVVTTGSRGGFIAEMVVVAFVLLGLLRESKSLLNRLLLISVMVVGGLTSLFYLNNYRFDVFDFQRFEELGYEITSGDFSGRGDIWRGGIQLFVDNPIHGYGGGSFREAIIASYGESIAPHNGFLATAVDLGVIGFIVIVSIWLHILILIRRNRNRNFDIMTCYVVLFMSWLSANMEYQEVNWFIFATMVSLSTAVLSKPVTTQSEALTYRVN